MAQIIRKKYKHWCFTINNPKEEDTPDLEQIQYLIVANEVGDNGTLHIQGYLCYKQRKYYTAVKKLMLRAHIEVKSRYSTVEQAIHYCMKPVENCKCKHCIKAKDQIPDFREYGERPLSKEEATTDMWNKAYESARIGEFEDIPKGMLIRCYHAFKRIHQDNPIKPDDLNKLTNLWIVAPTRYGKSYYARKMYPDYYDKSPNKWFVGYRGQSTILCDDFGPH